MEKHFEIMLLFSTIINESLGFFKKYDSEKLSAAQKYILQYSVQFLWHLRLQIQSPLKDQRNMSISILAKLLF